LPPGRAQHERGRDSCDLVGLTNQNPRLGRISKKANLSTPDSALRFPIAQQDPKPLRLAHYLSDGRGRYAHFRLVRTVIGCK